jgi:hypothetical protein
MENKIWNANEIKAQILTNDEWLYRAITAINDLQLEDEKVAYTTKYNNGVGFNLYDAKLLTAFAQQIAKRRIINITKTKNNKIDLLTTNQKTEARKRMIKYCKQLEELALKKVQMVLF